MDLPQMTPWFIDPHKTSPVGSTDMNHMTVPVCRKKPCLAWLQNTVFLQSDIA